VTIEELKKIFNTEAWRGLAVKDSKIVKILNHIAFKNEEEGQGAECIDVDNLLCYGLLLC